MTITSLMVSMQPGESNSPTLNAAETISTCFSAHVVGIALCQPLQMTYNDAYLAPDIYKQDQDVRAKQIEAAEADFRIRLRGKARSLSWIGGMTTESIATATATYAREADLIIAPVSRSRDLFALSHPLSVGDLIMKAGRPVLTVPPSTDGLKLDHILIGWRDGREARRAVADSLPLLGRARRVTIVEIVPARELVKASNRLTEVTAWLNRHGIAAIEPLALASDGNDAQRLPQVAAEKEAGLIVAGAYAHNRLQEWIFGGVTRELLFNSNISTLFSH